MCRRVIVKMEDVKNGDGICVVEAEGEVVRVVITSVDNHVIWECPLVSIVDLQVSHAAKDCVMVEKQDQFGVSRSPLRPQVDRTTIAAPCYSDSLNIVLRRALHKLGAILIVLLLIIRADMEPMRGYPVAAKTGDLNIAMSGHWN